MKRNNNEARKTLCINVDMLVEFDDGSMGNSRMKNIIPPMVKFLERKVPEGMKVLFVRDYHEEGDSELQMFPKHAMLRTPGAMIIEPLRKFIKKNDSNIINKKSYSALFNTSLADYILRMRPKKIYLMGVLTDICILHTAIELFYFLEQANLKTKVLIVKDCVESYDKGDHIADEVSKFTLAHIKNVLGFEIVETQEQL